MRSKSRLIAALAAMVACVAMVGTGFASWVILAESSAEGTGNVQAEAVSDDSIKNFSASVSGGNIVYGGSEGSNDAKGKWLINDAEAENLVATITLKGEGTIGALSATFSATEDWDTAVTNGIITAPVLSIDESTTGKLSVTGDGKGSLTDGTPDTYTYGFNVTSDQQTIDTSTGFVIKATFGWGKLFADAGDTGSNPYTFFNTKTAEGQLGQYYTDHETEINALTLSGISATSTWKDYAQQLLGKLYNLLSNGSEVQYKFTFTATPVHAAD